MTDERCGEPKKNGEPCNRDPGWGRKGVTEGPCRDHVGDFHNPKKLTPEVKSTLIGAAQEGAFKKHCAHLAEITRQTLDNWLEWGEEDVAKDIDSPCADLYLTFQRARSAGAVRHLKNVDSGFVLERSYGYTKSEEHQITGDGGGALEIVINDSVVESETDESESDQN